MPALTKLPSTARPCEVVSIIQRDGGVIIEDFLTPDQLDGIRADLLPKIAALPTGGDDFAGEHTRRLSALFAHSHHMADIVTHPLFREPAEELINTPVTYWSGEHAKVRKPGLRIGGTQLIQIAPSETAQRLHRDDWAFMWRHPAYGREARLQIMIAISDFTTANGGTLVIPGSHTWDDERMPDPSEAVPTEMGAGSALLWLGSVYHGGGTNTTADQLRTGLTMSLDAANVRQEENMYLALSPDVVKSYPADIQALLGWAWAQDSYMGWVEIDGQMRNPLELLR
jgi:hypothetical protein